MNHGVCGAAHCAVYDDCVFKSLAGKNLSYAQIVAYHFHDSSSGHVGENIAARIRGWNRGIVRESKAERFDHAGHRGGGSHSHAVAGGTRHASLGFHEVLGVYSPSFQLFIEAPYPGPRTDILSAILAIQHRTAGDHQCWNVATGGSHNERWCRLVTAAQKHDSIDRIAANGLFDIHADQVAKEHGGGTHVGLAHRHYGKFERKTASLPHSAFDNYSLFLRADGLLVGYVETDDFDLARDGMAQREVNERWQREMADFFTQSEGVSPDRAMHPLEEVFHL
jgi:L-rhamnose mutarotase